MNHKTLFSFGLSALLLTVGCGGDDDKTPAPDTGGDTGGGTGGSTGGGTLTPTALGVQGFACSCDDANKFVRFGADAIIDGKAVCLFVEFAKGTKTTAGLSLPTGWEAPEKFGLLAGKCSQDDHEESWGRAPTQAIDKLTGKVERTAGKDGVFAGSYKLDLVIQTKDKDGKAVAFSVKDTAAKATDPCDTYQGSCAIPAVALSNLTYVSAGGGVSFIHGETPDHECVVFGLSSTTPTISNIASGPTMTDADGPLHYLGWLKDASILPYSGGKCAADPATLKGALAVLAKNAATGTVTWAGPSYQITMDVVLGVPESGSAWTMKGVVTVPHS